MLNKRIQQLFLLPVSIISLGLGSCSTDFDLNASYDAIPVVYGLLDQTVDTQWVKVNKSFIGDGNNFDYAGINDSLTFDNVSGTLEDASGNILANLESKVVSGIDDGIFYNGTQTMYYFVPSSPLEFESQVGSNWIKNNYKINLQVDEGANVKEVSAETELVDEVKFSSQFRTSLLGGVNLAFSNSSTTGNYPDLAPNWGNVENGARYELSLRFYYYEYTATDTTRKYLDWNLGSQKSENLSVNQTMSKSVSGASFFEMVKSRLDGYAYEADVLKRTPDRFYFYLSAAAPEINTYMEVNEPATGVVTDRPAFTNINGGVGIFSARYRTVLTQTGSKKLALNLYSTRELCSGQYTSGFKFCTDSIAWTTQPFYCN